MLISISVQYNGGFLPEIILSTLCDNIGEPFFNKPFDCSEGLAAFRFFLRSYAGSKMSGRNPRLYCTLK